MISYKSKGPEAFRAYAKAEAARVADLIERDQAARERDQNRRIARGLAESGNFERLDETVMEPTPEWEAHGDAENFTPETRDGTVRTVKTRRRVAVPVAVRMCYAGKITDDQFLACMWYRSQYEAAGLEGRYKSSHISLTAGTSGGGGGAAQNPMPLHEREAEARHLFRLAVFEINRRFLPVFDNVVIHNMSLRAAATAAKRDNARLLANFRASAQRIANMCEARKISLTGWREK